MEHNNIDGIQLNKVFRWHKLQTSSKDHKHIFKKLFLGDLVGFSYNDYILKGFIAHGDKF